MKTNMRIERERIGGVLRQFRYHAAYEPSDEEVDDAVTKIVISCKAELDRLRAENAELVKLVQCLIDNDPNDMAADAVTVLDVWRKDAVRKLAKAADETEGK